MAATRPLPDQSYLRECFIYDLDAGTLYWRLRPPTHFRSNGKQSQQWICDRWNSRMGGEIVGCLSPTDGYYGCTLDGKHIRLHRLIWKLMTGEEPPEIDHENTKRADNRWCNLRRSTSQTNKWNSIGKRPGKLKGIWYDKRRGIYVAQIRIEGRSRHLGYHATAEAAHAAYCAAAKEAFGEFFNPG